jgi:hypothetical protein
VSEFLTAALRYAGRGRRVFPCNGKRPFTAHGLKDATTDRVTILRWWERVWPNANVAVRTGAESGIVVLDVDGEAGADTLHDLEREHGALPVTVESLTGGGGRHLYFKHPRRVIRNSAGQLGPGLDVRGDGGYAIAPPSICENGRAYEWAAERSFDDREPAELPRWLSALLQPTSPRHGDAPDKGIPEGRRNSSLASLAGSMRRRGMGVEAITAALKIENTRRLEPPLPEGEVRRIAASIAHYQPATYELKTDRKGTLRLPGTPERSDVAGLCNWLTAVFALDPAHPIVAGERQGVFGPEGHVELRRAEAPPFRFEPASRINTPMRLIETLSWRALDTDGAIPGFKANHCQQISHVIRMLCGAVEALTDQDEAAGIVGTFMHLAVVSEAKVTTYGTSGQRYEAALELRRPVDTATGRPFGPPRYAYDFNTGEMFVAISDLAEAARRHTGSSLPRGWLDARMSALGWRRIKLEGYALPNRPGRKGPHARIDVYRGHLFFDDPVTT